MSIDVFRATGDDWQLYRDIRLTSLRDAPWAFSATLEGALGFGEADWRHGLEAPSWLARRGGEGVGMIRLTTHEGRHYLSSMWVAPGARGTGLSDRLIDVLEAEAVRLGIPELVLQVVVDNAPAVQLYERRGYRDNGVRARTARGAEEMEMVRGLG